MGPRYKQMKEHERYFFKPWSLSGRKKQIRKDIKIRRHGFWDELGAMFVSSLWSLSTAHELNIASYVLLQNDRYISKAFIFFFQ